MKICSICGQKSEQGVSTGEQEKKWGLFKREKIICKHCVIELYKEEYRRIIKGKKKKGENTDDDETFLRLLEISDDTAFRMLFHKPVFIAGVWH